MAVAVGKTRAKKSVPAISTKRKLLKATVSAPVKSNMMLKENVSLLVVSLTLETHYALEMVNAKAC